jgi:hypothetical protein
MRIRHSGKLVAGAGLGLLVALGCGKDSVAPPDPAASVEVTSPIGRTLALGRTVQLEATAYDQQGDPLPDAPITWTTSNTEVATVSARGLVTAAGLGSATITASTPRGSAGTVSTTILLRVVAADLGAVASLAADPFGEALVAALSSAKRPAVQAAWGACATAAGTGNVDAIAECADDLRAQAASAVDPTDRALLATLALYADQIERLLHL